VHDHGRHAGDAHLVAVDHAEGQDGGDPGIDGITAAVQHLESCARGQLVAGADGEMVTQRNRYDGHGRLPLENVDPRTIPA
jgi:hypothetical protein